MDVLPSFYFNISGKLKTIEISFFAQASAIIRDLGKAVFYLFEEVFRWPRALIAANKNKRVRHSILQAGRVRDLDSA